MVQPNRPPRRSRKRTAAAARAARAPGEPIEFLRLLWALDHALQRRSKRQLREHGITGPQRLVLRILSTRDGLSAGQLAAELHLHPSTLTGVIERLVRNGFVRRRARPEDARSVELWLTPAGRRRGREQRGTIEAAVGRALERFRARELATVRALLVELQRELSC